MNSCSSQARSIGSGSTTRSPFPIARRAAPGSRPVSSSGSCCSSTSTAYRTTSYIGAGCRITTSYNFTVDRVVDERSWVAQGGGALRSKDLKRVTVDTTVQPKAITFPTDGKLLHAAIKGLNRLAPTHHLRRRPPYSLRR